MIVPQIVVRLTLNPSPNTSVSGTNQGVYMDGTGLLNTRRW